MASAAAPLEAFRARATAEALRVVGETMPQKVSSLTEWFDTLPASSSASLRAALEGGKARLAAAKKARAAERGARKRARGKSGVARQTKKRKKAEADAEEENDSDDTLSGSSSAAEDGRDGPSVKTGLEEEIAELSARLETEYYEALRSFSTLRVFVQMSVPEMSDGNNFGVSVQEEMLNIFTQSEETCLSMLDSASKHSILRARIQAKALKYPGVSDYRDGVQQLDSRRFLQLQMNVLSLRDLYAFAADALAKNWRRIEAPRGHNSHLSSMF